MLRNLLLLTGAGGLAGVIALYTVQTKESVLRASSALWTVWGVQAALIAMALATAMMARPLIAWWGRREFRRALLLFAGAFCLTMMSPRTNRILFDEVIYENIAQSIVLTGKANVGNYANVSPGTYEMIVPWVNKQPHGHPYILSLFFRVFGVNEQASPWVSRLETAVTVLVLYLIVATVLKLRAAKAPTLTAETEWVTVPTAAAVILAMTPITIWWSSTTASEPAAAMMDAFAILSTLLYLACEEMPALNPIRVAAGLFMAGALSGTAYFRSESPLIAAVAVGALFLFGKSWAKLETYVWLSLAALLATPQVIHNWSVRTENWGAKDGVRFSLSFLKGNLESNAGYFWDGKWFPQIFSILALIGIYRVFRQSWRLALWGIGWFIAAWGLFVFFYAGSYNYGADSRYAVISCAPVALFAGFGLVFTYHTLRNLRWVLCFLCIASLLHWSMHIAYVTDVGKQAAECRTDLDFVRQHAPLLPQRSLVLTDLPYFWMLQGVSAAQMKLVDRSLNDMPALLRRYPGGIYLHWGYWTAQRSGFATNAIAIINQCRGELLWCSAFGQFKYGLVRLDTKWAMEHLAPGPPTKPKAAAPDLEALFPNDYSLLAGKNVITRASIARDLSAPSFMPAQNPKSLPLATAAADPEPPTTDLATAITLPEIKLPLAPLPEINPAPEPSQVPPR